MTIGLRPLLPTTNASCPDKKNKRRPNGRLVFLVGARGFEPPTSCSRSRHATRLRYAPSNSPPKGSPRFVRQSKNAVNGYR